jgi:molybdopterin-guanine dinucleotide biosynthesis protein
MGQPIVVVGGVHKGAGKTTLSCFLLGHLKGWGALKVTTTHEGKVCPVLASCTACGEIDGPYIVERQAAVLEREGTDTWKMVRSGASRVVWLRATPAHLEAGLADAMRDFQDAPGIVVEGTNAARHIGDIYLLAARLPVRKIKPSARETEARADLPVLNLSPGWVRGGTDLLEAEIPAFRGGRPLPFHGLEAGDPDNDALLQEVLRRLAEAAGRKAGV